MTQFKWSSLSFTQKFFDLGILTGALALAVAFWLPNQPTLHAARHSVIIELGLFSIVLLGWNACLASLTLYGSRRLTRWHHDLGDVLRAVGLCSLTLAASARLFHWSWLNVWLLVSF